MTGRSHFLHGITAASWVSVPLAALGVPLGVVFAAGVVGAYAAYLPDIDHGSSTITWSRPPISNLVSWIVRGCPWHFWRWGGWLLPLWLTVSTGHRRETHTEEFAVAAGILLSLPLWWFTNWFWVFGLQITVGCLTHMWGDMRTVGGLAARDGKGRRYIGRTVCLTGSDYELRARYTRYRPAAILSVIASAVLVAMITNPTTLGGLS